MWRKVIIWVDLCGMPKKMAKGFLRIMNAAEKGGSIYDFDPRTLTRTTIPGEWYSIATKMIPACCVRGDAQEFKYVGLFFANDEGEASKMRWFLLRPLFPFFMWWTEFGWEGFFVKLIRPNGCTLTCARPATMMFEKIPKYPSSAKIFQLSDGNFKKKTWSTGSFHVTNNSKWRKWLKVLLRHPHPALKKTDRVFQYIESSG